jgi:6-phosphogluconolactonase
MPFPFPTEVFEDAEALARGAARQFVDAVRKAPGEAIAVALAGGSTPKRMYELLAEEFAGDVPWERMHWFFGDERFVPPDSPESNFRMACEALFDRAPVPVANLHPVLTVGYPLDEAARLYAQELARCHGSNRLEPGRPLFEVVLLGLGPDGHTASLFPDQPSLDETQHWAVGVPQAGVPPFVPRVTLTLPVLRSSAKTLFLVGGAAKRPVLARIAAGEKLPAALVTGETRPLWMLDREAAAELGL